LREDSLLLREEHSLATLHFDHQDITRRDTVEPISSQTGERAPLRVLAENRPKAH